MLERHCHFIRASLGSTFTHLIYVASPAGVAGGILISAIVRRLRDQKSIAEDVDASRVRPIPGETHRIYPVHLALRGAERDRSTAQRPVEPVNLIGIHASNTEYLSYPVCAAPDGTAQIPDCRSRIRLQHSVGPFPLALRVEGHIGLDLDPIRASAEHRRDGQV